MSDNIGGVFLTLLTWMMGILLGLNALWFGWQVNQVNDYNTQVGQMISKEGGYDRVSGWNAAELSAQSYHNHFALYSWVPGNKDADNRPVKGFKITESVTQANGDRIRYRIKAQIPLIAFVPKFKWTHTFDETIVSNAGDRSANHAGLVSQNNSDWNLWSSSMDPYRKVIDDKIGTLNSFKNNSIVNRWSLRYVNAAYDAGILTKPVWRSYQDFTKEDQQQITDLMATLLGDNYGSLHYGTGSSSIYGSYGNVLPYVSVTFLEVPDHYLNGYSADLTTLKDHPVRNTPVSLNDWGKDATGVSDYYWKHYGLAPGDNMNTDAIIASAQAISSVDKLYPPTNDIRSWLWEDWVTYHQLPGAYIKVLPSTSYRVYGPRLGQLTGNYTNHTQPKGEIDYGY